MSLQVGEATNGGCCCPFELLRVDLGLRSDGGDNKLVAAGAAVEGSPRTPATAGPELSQVGGPSDLALMRKGELLAEELHPTEAFPICLYRRPPGAGVRLI